MTVVPMQERHLAALAEIEKVCFHAPWSADMLREELGKGLFLVAERDGVAVGYVGCQTVLDEGYITNVAVSPDCRRQGVGRALIGTLVSHAGAQGWLLLRWRRARPICPRLPCTRMRASKRWACERIFTPRPLRTRC